MDPETETAEPLYTLTGVPAREIAMVRGLFADPETKIEQQRLIAKKYPNTKTAGVLPELQAREELDAARAEFKKATDEVKAEREKDKQQRALADARAALLADPDLRIRQEEIAEVEKIMTERYIGNHRDAARLLRAESVAPPRIDAAGIWLPGQQEQDDEYFKKLWNTPLGEVGAMQRDRLALHEAHTMQHEFKTGQGQRKYGALMTV